jgi:hypothetical protein
MPWWGWVLIAVGVVVIGWLKLSFFKKMQEKKQVKKRFTDGE